MAQAKKPGAKRPSRKPASPEATVREAGAKAAPKKPREPAKRCGLCGKRGKLVKTECCGNWICDDSHKYVLFSYALNSCFRNHDRYTLCAHHHREKHGGDWKNCKKCLKEIMTEMYVWYGTNEFNFEVLENPPAYEPTKCTACGRVIRLAHDGHAIDPKRGYLCSKCY